MNTAARLQARHLTNLFTPATSRTINQRRESV